MMTGKPGKTPSDMKVADDEYPGIQPSGFGVYIHWPFCQKNALIAILTAMFVIRLINQVLAMPSSPN